MARKKQPKQVSLISYKYKLINVKNPKDVNSLPFTNISFRMAGASCMLTFSATKEPEAVTKVIEKALNISGREVELLSSTQSDDAKTQSIDVMKTIDKLIANNVILPHGLLDADGVTVQKTVEELATKNRIQIIYK